MQLPNETLFDRAPDYSPVYRHLAELREEFHRSGKLDDSNAKLDEVVKLFATYLAYRSGSVGFFPSVENASKFSVLELQKAFAATCTLPEYSRSDGVSIFGEHPRLTLTQDDEVLAWRLTSLAKEAVDEAFRHFAEGRSYDVLNEAFGHFVRDNFRSNIEDAQYLTPSEVVDFMVSLAIEELRASGRLELDQPLLVADPCSGVASFLTAFSASYAALDCVKPELLIVAQDKVERMVRLSTINLALHKSSRYTASIGNSIFAGSPLDSNNGSVDLVLTNPPFGARFSQADIHREGGLNLPFFSSPIQLRGPIVDSELLFIDRDLHLLREGGLLAIIVPDSVISAKGTPALLRHHLKHCVEVRAVIELPSVTFAQAGTRTKTAVVLLRKQKHTSASASVVARCKSLGFEVSSRKGVLVKTSCGENDLPVLLDAYKKLSRNRSSCIEDSLEIASVRQEKLRDVWTPGHYISSPDSGDGHSQILLSDAVTFVGDARKRRPHAPGDTYISVLHILGDGLLDLQSSYSYAPKTPGVPVKPGEILFSRINPRIPRVLVVPKLEGEILCSTEFEVMKAKPGYDPYLVCFLLLTPAVQREILLKTSGTSASHNRIKTRELGNLSLPQVGDGSPLIKIAKSYEQAVSKMFNGIKMLTDVRGSYIDSTL
jgi:hypothetical protein